VFSVGFAWFIASASTRAGVTYAQVLGQETLPFSFQAVRRAGASMGHRKFERPFHIAESHLSVSDNPDYVKYAPMPGAVAMSWS